MYKAAKELAISRQIWEISEHEKAEVIQGHKLEDFEEREKAYLLQGLDASSKEISLDNIVCEVEKLKDRSPLNRLRALLH